MDLSIVIPCFNEAESIEKLFQKCKDSISSFDNIEYVFVDNGSTDDTNKIFTKLLQVENNNFAKLIKVFPNQGYGFGILKGLENCSGKILAWTHADLQTDPNDVINAFRKYNDCLIYNHSIVKGKRYNRPIIDNFFTFLMSLFSTITLKCKLSDINAQPKIFNSELFKEFKNPPNDFSLDLFLMVKARKSGLKILEFPVYFGKREYGKSKGGGSFKGKIKLSYRSIKYILKLRNNLRI